jgi:predicted phosphodiesterase
LRYAILSDIHSNIEALNAVLPVIEAQQIDKMICLGDMVGYYTNPNECLGIIQDRNMVCISGNHDRGAVGLKNISRFWRGARLAMPWTQKRLTLKSKLFLETLPLTRTVDDSFLMVHSSLDPDPDADFYIRSEEDARLTFNALGKDPSRAKICFFGHTHHPVVYEYDNGMIRKIMETTTSLNPLCYYLINPGSVGQSRDVDERASFSIYDTERATLSFLRVPYDKLACLQKAKSAGILYSESALSKQWKAVKIFAKQHYPAIYRLARNIVRRYVPFK